MYPTLQEKLARLEQLTVQLLDPQIQADSKKLTAAIREHGKLARVSAVYNHLQRVERDIAEATRLSMSNSKEEQQFAALMLEELVSEKETVQTELRALLVPPKIETSEQCIMEIRAGAGGNEAALFVRDLYEMYSRYADQTGWKQETLDSSPNRQGGFKELILGFSGSSVFEKLRGESGGHRVQRVPETEANGRVHTSMATVAVMPEPKDVEVELKPGDYRKDTFTSQGPGGQHVNRTESAVRLTHFKSGIVVAISDGRCQHKNFAKATRVLKSRLFDQQYETETKRRAEHRKSLVGTGGRSQRVRTYNFPANRVTDHRTNVRANLTQVLAGKLSGFIVPAPSLKS